MSRQKQIKPMRMRKAYRGSGMFARKFGQQMYWKHRPKASEIGFTSMIKQRISIIDKVKDRLASIGFKTQQKG